MSFDVLTRPGWGLKEELKKNIRSLFLGEIKVLRKDQCEICFNPLQQEEQKWTLSHEMIKVILKTLLVSDVEQTDECEFKGALELCQDCVCMLTKMTNVYLNLDALKCQFNTLRRKVTRKVICESLNRPDIEWRLWKNELRKMEGLDEFGNEFRKKETETNSHATSASDREQDTKEIEKCKVEKSNSTRHIIRADDAKLFQVHTRYEMNN